MRSRYAMHELFGLSEMTGRMVSRKLDPSPRWYRLSAAGRRKAAQDAADYLGSPIELVNETTGSSWTFNPKTRTNR